MRRLLLACSGLLACVTSGAGSRPSLVLSIRIVTLVIAVPLAALFAYDRFVAAPGPFRGKSIHSMDIYPYTGLHLVSNFANGDLRTGDNGFFIDFPIKSPPPKSPDEFRIILTGGSAAMGLGALSNDKMIAKVLETFLNERPPIERRFTVINMAMAAAHTYQNYIALNQWAHPLKPDLILSLSGGRNDIFVPYLTGSDLPFGYPEVMGLTAATRDWEGPSWWQWLESLFPNLLPGSRLGMAIRSTMHGPIGERQRRDYVARNVPPGSLYDSVIEPLYLHALRSMKRDFEGIPIMVAFEPIRRIPIHENFNVEWMEMYAKLRSNVPHALTHYVNEAWSFIDVHQIFSESGLLTPEFLWDDTHLTEGGQRKVAEFLYLGLKKMLPALPHMLSARSPVGVQPPG